jgi:hypothetical protein
MLNGNSKRLSSTSGSLRTKCSTRIKPKAIKSLHHRMSSQ